MTSNPLVSRTFATLRNAEFGFFGVVVYTRVQTPRFCGDACRAGTVLRALRGCRGLAINWLIVGIFAFATFSLGCCANGTVRTAPRLISCGQSPSSASSWACRPASARADRYARNLARLSHAQNEIAPSAKLRQGALPFGRTRCG